MRSIGFAATALVILVLSACGGGDGDARPPEGSARGPSGLSANGVGSVLVGAPDLGVALGAEPALQGSRDGVTVSGYGEASATPTGASIRLSISAGDAFFSSSDSFNIEFIEAEELEPVVDAIKAQGVDEDDISVNAFAQSQYGYGGAAEITFQWPKPDGISELAGEIQDAVRRETDYSLAGFQVLFTVDDCEALETEAQEAALEDAREKAERLGKLAGLEVGDITGVMEGGGLASIYGLEGGCATLEQFPTDFFSSSLSNSASEVTIDATLSVTFAAE
jgi:uncharacterized protein YggE